MCILFIYSNPKPDQGGYRLIVASNRDEFYKRSAKKAYLCNETNIIGGRDMQSTREGGMWLGAKIKEQGTERKLCCGVILNISGEPLKENAMGRGFIIVDYLNTSEEIDQYLDRLDAMNHNSYTFVTTELGKNDSRTVYHSNAPTTRLLYEGKQILGFGNSPAKTPLNKVERGIEKFKEIIERDLKEEQLIEELCGLLKCPDRHLPDPELQKRRPEIYEFLSSIFIKSEEYGTRTHSILLVDYDWNVSFIEHTLKEPIDPDNPEWETTVIKSNL